MVGSRTHNAGAWCVVNISGFDDCLSLLQAVEALKVHNGKIEEAAYQRALKSLKDERKQALIDGDADKFVMVVDPGKAYIQGYEIEAIASQYIPMNKARENSITGEENGHILRMSDQSINATIGNYVLVTNVYSYPNITTFQQVYLVKTLNSVAGNTPSSSDIVGTARVKAFQLHSSDYTGGVSSTQYKLGLFDVQMLCPSFIT